MEKISYGYCQCGCGNKTRISDRNHKRYGWFKGEPRRFLRGHNRKNYPTENYPTVFINGVAKRLHVFICEKVLGKKLPSGAVVHHLNGDIQDNRNQNLVICESHSYHGFIHARMRALKESGDKNKRKCVYCHKYDFQKNLTFKHGNGSGYHKSCNASYHRQLKGEQNA